MTGPQRGMSICSPANKMHSKDPGDDKGMATARNRFLSGDYYAPSGTPWRSWPGLCPRGGRHSGRGLRRGLLQRRPLPGPGSGGKAPGWRGGSLKHALRRAAKREKAIEFAVASVYDLPVADRQADLLVNCFSPLALEEFLRVLRPGGLYFYVVPGARHLWELKEVLYPNPYPNEEKLTPYRGLRYLEVKEVDGSIHLPDQQTISDLFQMTPYFWKTPKEGAQRLSQLAELDTTISFRIHVFRKEG